MSKPYLLYKEDCIQAFHELQDEFIKQYNVDNHTSWHYDHGLRIFTLGFEGHSHYFEYVDVGSYSNESNTWKWSWDNEHTPDHVKVGMDKIPDFGRKHNYEELTTGLLEGEREIGFEMTSIANQLINGFGAYRAVSSHLDIYFLFTREIEEEKYKKLKRKYVDCGEHGSRRIAYVCQHLMKGKLTGFEEAFPTTPNMELHEDDDFQAWCDECEKVRLKYDGWNKKSEKFAQIKLICEKCYFEIKEFNLGPNR